MKKRILLLTIIFVLGGAVVLGFTLVNLSHEEAYTAAVESNRQSEINELYLTLQQIQFDNSVKNASITAINTYGGRLTKYYTPFISETSLEVKKLNNGKAVKQLEIDVVSAAMAYNDAMAAYRDSEILYNEAAAEYSDAVEKATLSKIDILSLKYTAESRRISMLQSVNNLDSAKNNLEVIVGQKDITVEIPGEYSNPYDIDSEKAYKKALETDIGIYQTRRNTEAAEIKFDIAKIFYDEDEENYISALAGLKSAELAYENALLSLEISIYDDIDNLKNKYDSIELEKLNNEIKLTAYNAATSQYNTGIISKTSLENAESAYTSAKKQLASKINTYIISSMRFTLGTGYTF